MMGEPSLTAVRGGLGLVRRREQQVDDGVEEEVEDMLQELPRTESL